MTVAWVAVLSVLGLTILTLPGRHGGTNSQVVGIVSGDTVLVHDKTGDRRVRLLNVDTPKSNSPTAKNTCLAPQATSELRQLLPAGTKVKVEYDGEHRDRFGRDLAGIYLSDGKLVNAEIARAGLGNPVSSDDSTTYLDDVKSAQSDAFKDGRGFFDSARACTVPGQIKAIETRLRKARAEKPRTVAQARRIAADLADAVSDAKAFMKKLKSLPDDPAWLAYSGNRLSVASTSVSTIIDAGTTAEADVLAASSGLPAGDSSMDGGDPATAATDPTTGPTTGPTTDPTQPPTDSSSPTTGGSTGGTTTPPKHCILPNGKVKKHCK